MFVLFCETGQWTTKGPIVLLSIKGAAFNQGKTIGPKEGNLSVRGKALWIKKGRAEVGLIWGPGEVQTR